MSRNRTRPRREEKTLRGRFCVSAKGIVQLVGKPFQLRQVREQFPMGEPLKFEKEFWWS